MIIDLTGLFLRRGIPGRIARETANTEESNAAVMNVIICHAVSIIMIYRNVWNAMIQNALVPDAVLNRK